MIELIKAGDEKSAKKALKVARKKLGSHHRGIKKRDFI
ncbi:UNVERIFIED_CONTAM: hypothetical protein GTU68_055317 [Idotea baltica]|nr:hypothetical protein [Idotea baltica]